MMQAYKNDIKNEIYFMCTYECLPCICICLLSPERAPDSLNMELQEDIVWRGGWEQNSGPLE